MSVENRRVIETCSVDQHAEIEFAQGDKDQEMFSCIKRCNEKQSDDNLFCSLLLFSQVDNLQDILSYIDIKLFNEHVSRW